MVITEKIRKAVEDALLALKKEGKIDFDKLPEIKIEHPQDMDLGDYATNIALILAKKEKKPPKELASLIIGKLPPLARSSTGGKIARPSKPEGRSGKNFNFLNNVQEVSGFINFFVSKEYLAKELLNILKEKEKYGSGETKEGLFGRKKKILVEYSSPNIAKPFGIGHLRSTIIGQAICNIYKFLGWDTIGVNHLGDWGTPHGKIISKLVSEGIADDPEKLDKLTVADLEKHYREFNKLAMAKPEIEEKARQWFKRLEDGDERARKIWKHIKDISLREFERVYSLLGVEIDNVMGESFYEDKMEDIIKECKDKKITKKSEGAWIVDFEDLPPAMLVKSDGATTYFTRDLAALKYRFGKFSPDTLVYETGIEQILHFKQVFETARMLGWVKSENLVHVGHGLYGGKHGKFSTRKGDTVHLEDILKESVERAKKIIEESETARGFSDEEKDKVARAVGIGGIKYNDLSHNPKGDIVFDWDKILNLKGSSAPYIQYTYARCRSILRKGETEGVKPPQAPLKGLNPSEYPSEFSLEEVNILRFIYRFPEVVCESAEKFSPNLIANFALELSAKFNLFYEKHSVLEAESQRTKEFRLLLTSGVGQTIRSSMSLLGIKTPEKL